MLGDAFGPALAAAQAGAEWGFEVLYRELNPGLGRYLRARAGAEADDVASTTWLDVARSIAGFDGDEDHFRGWLFTIARRRLADNRRRSRRRPTVGADDEWLEQYLVAPAVDEEAFAGRLGDEAARRIVAILPDEQADIVLLRVVAGLSVEEVAAIVGRRPGTVRVIQHRALRRLAEKLGDA